MTSKCKQCSKDFEKKVKQQKFCSDYCRKKFSRLNTSKEVKRQQKRKWRAKNIEKNRAEVRRGYWKNKDKSSVSRKKYRQLNPEKTYARNQARKLKDLPKECFHCGSSNKLYKHHPDYSKPLEVVVLCPSCHNKLHHQKEDINNKSSEYLVQGKDNSELIGKSQPALLIDGKPATLEGLRELSKRLEPALCKCGHDKEAHPRKPCVVGWDGNRNFGCKCEKFEEQKK